jgi:hypothetical protein
MPDLLWQMIGRSLLSHRVPISLIEILNTFSLAFISSSHPSSLHCMFPSLRSLCFHLQGHLEYPYIAVWKTSLGSCGLVCNNFYQLRTLFFCLLNLGRRTAILRVIDLLHPSDPADIKQNTTDLAHRSVECHPWLERCSVSLK